MPADTCVSIRPPLEGVHVPEARLDWHRADAAASLDGDQHGHLLLDHHLRVGGREKYGKPTQDQNISRENVSY